MRFLLVYYRTPSLQSLLGISHPQLKVGVWIIKPSVGLKRLASHQIRGGAWLIPIDNKCIF